MTDPTTAPMPEAKVRCPRCQTLLAGCADPAGLCPGCVMQLAMQPATGSGGAATPAIAELQPLFPAYELQTLIGRGGMGAVYRARHLKLDRLVALKVLLPDLVRDPAFAERFEREARALARLDHPGIVGVHDFGRAGVFFFLVMEFVDGANLRDLLVHGRLSSRDVLNFVPQLCDALQYAHDQRIVHRDIKPENILIDQEGRVRIADFGLAKLLGQEAAPIGLTQTHQAVGTPHYMAPEQIHAANQVDHRADLYSLGVVLYEMLTGQLPIGRFQPPSAKTGGAKGLDPVVMRSLESDPEQRYQQAKEVKRDVDAAGRATGGAYPPTPPIAEDELDSAPPPTRPGWFEWLPASLVLLACFLPWARVQDHATEMTVSAWQFTVYGVPAWSVLVIAVITSLLCSLRAAGHPTPPGSPFIATMVGTLYCGNTLLVIWNTEELWVRIGLPLTLLIFLLWNTAELRRHGTASLHRRQQRLTREESDRASP